MKIVFDDKSEMELNEDEQITLSAMMACYAALASRDIEGAVTTVMLTEMRYNGITRKLAKEIGEKVILAAAAKKGYSEADLEEGIAARKEGSASGRVKELFK